MTAQNDEQTPSGKVDEQTTGDPINKQPKHTLKHFFESFWHTLTKFIVLILTVTALVISYFQLRQANKADQDSKERAGQLSAQVESLNVLYKELTEHSTKYVGVFPDNMHDINDLLDNETHQSLTVVVDIAAYAHFSSPSNSSDYITALIKLSSKNDIEIRFICYDSDTAKIYLKRQFGWDELVKKNHGSEAEAWKEFTETNKDKIAGYKKWHESDMPQSMDDLVDQITDAGNDLLKMLKKRGAIIKETSKDLPIFMWIGDKEAIFSLHTYGQDPREHSFKTYDPDFIGRLKEIYTETENAKDLMQGQPRK